MARKRKAASTVQPSTPIAAMIDIIFLLIIFFVVTAAVDREVEDSKVILSYAPHGKPVTKRDPRSVIINVRKDGTLTMGIGERVNMSQITNILNDARGRWGNDIPIIIRGHRDVQHYYIKKVMDAVTDTGLYRVLFNAAMEG